MIAAVAGSILSLKFYVRLYATRLWCEMFWCCLMGKWTQQRSAALWLDANYVCGGSEVENERRGGENESWKTEATRTERWHIAKHTFGPLPFVQAPWSVSFNKCLSLFPGCSWRNIRNESVDWSLRGLKDLRAGKMSPKGSWHKWGKQLDSLSHYLYYY